MRQGVMWAALAAVVAWMSWTIADYERRIGVGATVLLELAPVDPRSLMQGDYMVLRYALAQELGQVAAEDDWPSSGALAVQVDAGHVAISGRLLDPDGELADRERRMRYTLGPCGPRRCDVRLAPESFFFQEGHAAAFGAARYGELRVTPDGDVMLVGLLHADGRPVDPG